MRDYVFFLFSFVVTKTFELMLKHVFIFNVQQYLKQEF